MALGDPEWGRQASLIEQPPAQELLDPAFERTRIHSKFHSQVVEEVTGALVSACSSRGISALVASSPKSTAFNRFSVTGP
jgi:hypothetical protein